MYFLCRLIPPRPSFAKAVMDPKGPWGVGIVSVSDQEELDKLPANDPAIRARIGLSYEAFVMPQLVHASR